MSFPTVTLHATIGRQRQEQSYHALIKAGCRTFKSIRYRSRARATWRLLHERERLKTWTQSHQESQTSQQQVLKKDAGQLVESLLVWSRLKRDRRHPCSACRRVGWHYLASSPTGALRLSSLFPARKFDVYPENIKVWSCIKQERWKQVRVFQ